MPRTRWAVLGPGRISADFARSLPSSTHGELVAVGSRSPARAAAFASAHGVAISGASVEVLRRDDVDAVYIGTVHTAHAALVLAALAAGKAVLCEKPATTTAAQTEELLAAAGRAGRPFVEAFKYRFGPLADRLRTLVADGALGDGLRLDTSFGFAAETETGRLFDPALGGGAILDAGCYPASLAVGVAAWAGGDVTTPHVDDAGAAFRSGVDTSARARLRVGAVTARVRTSIVQTLPRALRLRGSAGEIHVPNVWGSRTAGADVLILRRGTARPHEERFPTVQPMAAEADAVSLALAEGRTEVPEMTWAETAGVARVLDAWRAALAG